MRLVECQPGLQLPELSLDPPTGEREGSAGDGGVIAVEPPPDLGVSSGRAHLDHGAVVVEPEKQADSDRVVFRFEGTRVLLVHPVELQRDVRLRSAAGCKPPEAGK